MKRMSCPTFVRTANHDMSTYTTSTTNSKRRRTSGRTWVIQTHTSTFNELTRISVYIFWLLCVGLGTLEESEAKRISRSDQKGRREEDDGEANDSGWRSRPSPEEHQDIQRNRRGEVRHKLKSLHSSRYLNDNFNTSLTFYWSFSFRERREQELHEQYCKASTPEEKAAVLQRYALRFTISDAILEKLQLPKLPSAASPMHTSPLHQPEKKLTCTTLVEAEAQEPEQTTQTHHSVHVDQKIAQKQAPAQPKTPEPSPAEATKAPEILSAPTRVPPAPSKPVPLITPKPYSQPKFSQGLRKSVKARLLS